MEPSAAATIKFAAKTVRSVRDEGVHRRPSSTSSMMESSPSAGPSRNSRVAIAAIDKLIHRLERPGADGLFDSSFLIGLQRDRHVVSFKREVPTLPRAGARVNPILYDSVPACRRTLIVDRR